MTVQTFAGGRVSGSGAEPQDRLPQTQERLEIGVAEGAAVERRRKSRGVPLKVKVRVGFLPSKQRRTQLHGLQDRHLPLAADRPDRKPASPRQSPG